MSDYIEFAFDDGSSVMLRTVPAMGPPPLEAQPEPQYVPQPVPQGPWSPTPVGGPPPQPGAPQPQAGPAPAGLPPGLGGARPVGREAKEPAKVTRLAQDALRSALRPLVPLLQEVHSTMASVPYRPHEVSVEFGVVFGSDLKLGIVSGNGEASLTVSATWQLPPRESAASDHALAAPVALPQAR